MQGRHQDERARVHLPDMIVGTAVVVAIIYLGPVVTDLTADVEFDPFTQMMVDILVPFLFILVFLAVGVSAVRRD